MKEMPDNRNGYFKKRDRGFTITLNKVLQDRNLSMAAIGLCSRINCHIVIPDFEVSKSFIFHTCREGKKADRKHLTKTDLTIYPKKGGTVRQGKKVTKRQMLEHISLPESGQIKRIDEMLCDGRIYSVNGLQTYLYNALYLGTAADKGRPAAEKLSSGRTYTREEFCDIEKRLLNKKADKTNTAVPDG